MSKRRSMKGDISKLPEECLSHILSFTSPRDTCRSSTVTKFFLSAADVDGLWNCFLPEDCTDILQRASPPVGLFQSKKDLFFYLCQPIFIDQGKKSFALEKSSGKKCYMLSSKELSIEQGNLQNSRLIYLPESRFLEGTKINSWWLDIKGNFNSADLSPRTTYVVYFIYKLNPRSSRTPSDWKYQEALVLLGTQLKKEVVILESHVTSSASSSTTTSNWWHGNLNHMLYYQAQLEHPKEIKYFPKERGDGWMEIIMGDFFNEDGSDGDVEISLLDIDGGLWKSDVIVEGIELRPK